MNTLFRELWLEAVALYLVEVIILIFLGNLNFISRPPAAVRLSQFHSFSFGDNSRHCTHVRKLRKGSGNFVEVWVKVNFFLYLIKHQATKAHGAVEV